MTVKIGINGFGRMGRLVMRAAYSHPEIEIIQINDPAGDAKTLAHLINFDSVHGTWKKEAQATENGFVVDSKEILVTANTEISATDWSKCDVVIECSGKMKSKAKLQAYLDQGVKRDRKSVV